MCIAVMRGLARFAFADAVGARLGEQQRLVAGDVLQAREIGAQLGLAVQVDVERADVEEREIEKLGRRKIDVGEQALGRCALGVLVQRAEEPLDAHAAVPADDAGGISLPSANSEHGGVIAELANLARRSRVRIVALQRAIVEKRDVLRPRQPDHDAQAVCARLRRAGRGAAACRRADRVDAELRHQAEVFGDLRGGGN